MTTEPAADAPVEAAPGRTPGLAFILAIVLLDIAGIGLAIPVVPALVATFTGGDLSQASVHVGTMSALYTGAMFLCAPLLGALSDRFGRKPVLLGALAVSAASFFCAAFAPSLALLLLARGIGGIGGASLTVAQTYIADVSSHADRAKNFGLVGAAFGIGFILGPAVGGWLGAYGPHVPFLAAGVVATLNLVYGALLVPESHKPENRRAFTWKEANPLGWIVVLRRHPAVAGFAFALVWVWFGQQCMYNVWVLYTTHQFGWGPVDNGLSLAVVGITTAIVQAALVGTIIGALGERRTIVWGLYWGAASFVAYGLATQGWMMYALIVLASVGGVSGPVLQGHVSKLVGPDQQGGVQGALTSLTSLTGVFGPLLANNVFAVATAKGSALPYPGAPVFVGAFFLAVGAVLAARMLDRPGPTPAEQPQEPVAV